MTRSHPGVCALYFRCLLGFSESSSWASLRGMVYAGQGGDERAGSGKGDWSNDYMLLWICVACPCGQLCAFAMN